ncbi:heme ABC transporter ATP-binding protein [Flexithrix dorotheae]|uniref:heme ABC transporter ATP-binding protein n=1 Tax=Flexithrix dorotheae TaxID=70993 RepID=UPI00036B460A|nr:heme ABC transporter ATP-binding protein [Flexithrix dorotheae]
MIIAKDISKKIGKSVILKDCNLRVKPGCFTAVVGPNGAGKSSLMKILSGEIASYSGSIRINGKNIHHYKSKELSALRAVLPQHTIVNFPFTVEQVIEIGRYAHQTTTATNQKIIEEVLRLTGLTDFKNRLYQTLSGGEKQRVQMARVMTQIHDFSPEPKYLFLDEPTSSLDLAQQQSLLGLAKSLTQKNVGVLAILHDLNLATQFADEMLFLKKGETIAVGKAEVVIKQDIIEETFNHPVRIINDNGQKIIIPDSGIQNKSENLNAITYGHIN